MYQQTYQYKWRIKNVKVPMFVCNEMFEIYQNKSTLLLLYKSICLLERMFYSLTGIYNFNYKKVSNLLLQLFYCLCLSAIRYSLNSPVLYLSPIYTYLSIILHLLLPTFNDFFILTPWQSKTFRIKLDFSNYIIGFTLSPSQMETRRSKYL